MAELKEILDPIYSKITSAGKGMLITLIPPFRKPSPLLVQLLPHCKTLMTFFDAIWVLHQQPYQSIRPATAMLQKLCFTASSSCVFTHSIVIEA